MPCFIFVMFFRSKKHPQSQPRHSVDGTVHRKYKGLQASCLVKLTRGFLMLMVQTVANSLTPDICLFRLTMFKTRQFTRCIFSYFYSWWSSEAGQALASASVVPVQFLSHVWTQALSLTRLDYAKMTASCVLMA